MAEKKGYNLAAEKGTFHALVDITTAVVNTNCMTNTQEII